MIKLTIRKTRPSSDIPFFDPSLDYKIYFKEKYIDTGKAIPSSSVSADGLTYTTEIMWSEEGYKEFTRDSYCVDNFARPDDEHSLKFSIKVELSLNDGEFFQIPEQWKQYDPVEYFSSVQIPDDWDTLEDFVDWYMSQRMPMMIPWDAEVIRSDDAVAICVFRKGNYQVEFYIEYPDMYIRKHAHPRMEVIVMQLGGGGNFYKHRELGVANLWGMAVKKLPENTVHGGESTMSLHKGFITLAFQKWEDPNEMTSAAVQWNGEVQGDLQIELIKSKKTNPVIAGNRVDVSDDTSNTK